MKQYRHRRSANPSHVFPTLEPGELSVNTANRQLAAGDANAVGVGTPLPLLAVRYFDVRGIYAVGDHVVNAGTLYRCIVAHGPAAFDPAHFGAAAGSGGGGLTISDTPPGTPTDGMLWWESDTGKLYVRYNDGVGAAQWVEAVAVPQIDTSSFTTKTYVDAADALKADKTYVDAADAALSTSVAGKVAKAGDTMSGDLAIAKANPGINLNKPASGSTNYINGMTNNLRRWALVLGNNGAEGALNVGSDFVLSRHDNAGNWIEDPIVIDRSSGLVTLAHDPINPLHAATKQYVDAGVRAINYTNTTAYTFILSDTGKLVLLNNTGNLAQSATVPANATVAFAIGAQIDLCVTATNVVTTIAPAAGVTIWSEGSKRKLPMSGSCATLIKIGADMWSLSGSLIA
jgi:hypothetical protein